MVRNYITWTSVKLEKPSNQRPVTIVIRGLKGAHTMGAYYKKDKDKWFDMYFDEEIEGVICWADVEIPEEYIF